MCNVCVRSMFDSPEIIIVFESNTNTFDYIFSCHRSRALTQHGFSALLLLLLLLCWTRCCCCPHHSSRGSMSFVECSIKQLIHGVGDLSLLLTGRMGALPILGRSRTEFWIVNTELTPSCKKTIFKVKERH